MRAATHPALDSETLARARTGDRHAITTVLELHYEQIHRMLVHLVGRSPDLDDLRQQVLLAIVQGLPAFRADSSFSTWIGGICVNVAKTHYRAKRKRSERTIDDGQPAIDEARGADSAAQIESRAELVAVERALATLSLEQRTALVLANVYGHSIDEIAKMMKAAKSTTRLRLYYGRKKLATALGRRASTRSESESEGVA
ncbi:MAG: RNA polymerase sigma factor [Kofleriaceae bacterium]